MSDDIRDKHNKCDTLLPPDMRRARTLEKRKIVLKFLRNEIWTHGDVVADLLGFRSRQAGYKTLAAMTRDGLLKQAKIETGYGRPIVLWGISNHGQAMAWQLDEVMPENPRVFEPSKIKPLMMAHNLDIQRMRIRAEKTGWTDWCAGDAVFKKEEKMKYPDAIATSPEGVRVAFEIERTIKSKKRYEEIIVAHLLSRRASYYDFVLYLSPETELVTRIQRALCIIEYVRFGGKTIKLTDKHRQIFRFACYHDDWQLQSF